MDFCLEENSTSYLHENSSVLKSVVLDGEVLYATDDYEYEVSDLPIVSSNTTRDLVITYLDSNDNEYEYTTTLTQYGLKYYTQYSYESTQTTITINITPASDKTASPSSSFLEVDSVSIEMVDNTATYIVTNLLPSHTYSYDFYAYYENERYLVKTLSISTKSISWELENQECTPTTFSSDIEHDYGDAIIDSIYVNVDGSANVCLYPDEWHFYLSGLMPETSYTVKACAHYKGSNVSRVASSTFTTPSIEITTNQPDVTSSTTANISATTNIDDLETNVGFEWRKMDAPDEVASK